MADILHSKNFAEQLTELSNMDFEISESRGFPVLEQTKRNTIRGELAEGLANFLADYLENLPNSVASAFMTEDGIAIEVMNDNVGQKVSKNAGVITMMVDLKFKSLEYDAVVENELYIEHMKQKQVLAADKAEVKRKKAAADLAKRLSKKTVSIVSTTATAPNTIEE